MCYNQVQEPNTEQVKKDEITSFEQLEKRVEWLDNERRNDKTNLPRCKTA
jgi:hypothetical protein